MNPVVILHGALGSADQLEPVKNVLTAKGIEVHSLNFSGHGGAPFQSSFGIAQFADDLLRELDARKLHTADLFGYSMGGYVALWFAKNYPHRVGRIITLGTKFDWSEVSALQETKKLNPEKIVEKVPAFARILESRHAPTDWKELMQQTSSMVLALGRSPLLTEDVLKTILQPVVVCLGDQDDMADQDYSREVAGYLPNGKFIELNNTPHPIEKVSTEILVEIVVKGFAG